MGVQIKTSRSASSHHSQRVFPGREVLLASVALLERGSSAFIRRHSVCVLSYFWCIHYSSKSHASAEETTVSCKLVCVRVQRHKQGGCRVGARLNVFENSRCTLKEGRRASDPQRCAGCIEGRGEGKAGGELRSVLNQWRKTLGRPGSLNI